MLSLHIPRLCSITLFIMYSKADLVNDMNILSRQVQQHRTDHLGDCLLGPPCSHTTPDHENYLHFERKPKKRNSQRF